MLSGVGALDDLRDEWLALASEVDASYFQTPMWVRVWHDVLEPQARIEVVCRRNADGALCGVLPLAYMRRQLHSRVPLPLGYWGIAGAGRGSGDHLGPVAESAADVDALLAAAAAVAGRRTVLFESVDPDCADRVAAALGAQVIDRVRCPRIAVPPEGDVVDAYPKKLRKNVRRRARLMDDEGVTGRWVASTGELVGTLAALGDLHVRRWKSKGGAGLFDDDRLRFLSELTCVAGARSGARMYVLEDDGMVISALFGLVQGATFSIYKTGWDPDYKRFGLGIALATAALQWSQANGIATVDYLRGSEAHKYELGALDRVDSTLLVPRGVTGRLLAWREDMALRRADAESGRDVPVG